MDMVWRDMRGNLKAERARLGLTAEEAAKGIGVSVSTLRSWEQGIKEPQSINLINAAKFYGCDPEYLLDLTDEQKPVIADA